MPQDENFGLLFLKKCGWMLYRLPEDMGQRASEPVEEIFKFNNRDGIAVGFKYLQGGGIHHFPQTISIWTVFKIVQINLIRAFKLPCAAVGVDLLYQAI